MEHILKIKNLSIVCKKTKTHIVKDISFNVPKNRIVCVIGESGSGKTMTSKAIMGLLDNKKFNISGRAMYRDKNLIGNNTHTNEVIGRDISFIMQNPMTAFNPSLKMGTQIIETIKIHKKISRKEAFSIGVSALSEMALPRPKHIMNAYPHTLSGGMLQRCMIAISLLFNPKLIIADESTTAIDVKTQEIILNKFLELKNKGLALMFITHDFDVVSKIADYVVVMKSGLVVEQGETNDILCTSKHHYTQELLHARLSEGENYYG